MRFVAETRSNMLSQGSGRLWSAESVIRWSGLGESTKE